MLDVGAGTGCLIPSLLRIAGSEQRKKKKAASPSDSDSDSLPLPMDYLAVDVSAGMLEALERIHGGQKEKGQKERGEEEEEENYTLLGNLPGIRTWLGDVESVPPYQAPFDACFFNAVFGNVHDQRSSLLSAALLLRPGSGEKDGGGEQGGGRIVVAHPMGRRWHDRLRAADAEIVPHPLPRDTEQWAELLRGLPLELVEVEEEGERVGGAATTSTSERGNNGGNENASSSSLSSSSLSSSRRLLVDDEDCYIAVLRVPPAWRLPASLFGTLRPVSSASSFSSSSDGGGSSTKEGAAATAAAAAAAAATTTTTTTKQFFPRLPWQQREEEAGEQQRERGRETSASAPRVLLLGGTVVKGFGRGSSKMGIPTANLDLQNNPLLDEESLQGVPDGVYFGWARLLPENKEGEREKEEAEDLDLDNQVHKCVLNVGRRPTFDGEGKGIGVLSVEVHVLHEFSRSSSSSSRGREGGKVEEELFANLCGRELRVAATGFLRPEMRFPGIAALVSRIRADVATASAALAEEEEHGWAKGIGYLWGEE